MEPKISNPPPIAGRTARYDWEAIARKVEKANGEWVLVNPDTPLASSVAWQIRQGNFKAFRPPEKYEVTSRVADAGPPKRDSIYIRLNPEYKEDQ